MQSSQPDHYAQLLKRHAASAGFSQNRLAREIGCDPAHINRMMKTGAWASRDILLAISRVLRLSDSDRDRLLYAAGHAPVLDYQGMYEALVRINPPTE